MVGKANGSATRKRTIENEGFLSIAWQKKE